MTGPGTEGHNPAWDELLNTIPEDYQESVKPILQKWDQGVQEKINKVQEEYEPWKEFADADVDPEVAKFGLDFLQAVNDDPQRMVDLLMDHYGITKQQATQQVQQAQQEISDQQGKQGQQGQQGGGQSGPDLSHYDKKFNDLEQQNRIIAQSLVDERESKAQQEADVELDNELNALQEQNSHRGGFDERIVLAFMQTGMEAQDAVEEYFTWAQEQAQKSAAKPMVMGGGGSLPNNSKSVTELSEKDTRGLVVDMLEAAKRENQ